MLLSKGTSTNLAIRIAKLVEARGAGSGPMLDGFMKLFSRHAQSGDPLVPSPVYPKLQILVSGSASVYAKFFREVMNFALAPDGARQGQAADNNCGTPQGAWMWIDYQVKEIHPDP